MKFFIVGKKVVLLGKEKEKNRILFTIGKDLFTQINFAEVIKIKNNIYIKDKIIDDNKNFIEGLPLLLKVIKNNFKKSKIFVDNCMYKLSCDHASPQKIKLKYKNLIDVYNNPLNVPWNFMPTEIEDILSYFDKDVLNNKKILYIGAGYGKNIWALKDSKYDYDIDAIEYSVKAVNRANVIFGDEAISHKDLLSLKGCKNKYDVVLDIGCLHCIPAKFRQKAVDIIHNVLEDKGIIISRVFKPRDKKWIRKMPFKINNFGLNSQEIQKLFSNKFIVEKKYENSNYKILEFIKC